MPVPTHTPASARRFLPVSTATSRSHIPKFTQPSTSLLEDDIETSFEDRDLSRSDSRAPPFTRKAQPHLRDIVDEDVSDGEIEEVDYTTSARRSGPFQKQAVPRHFKESEKDNIADVPSDGLSEQPFKRRRLTPLSTVMDISSSPTPDPKELTASDEDVAGTSKVKPNLSKRHLEIDNDSDDDFAFSPFQPTPLSNSRFKTLAKGNTGLDIPSRPIFKPDHAGHLSPSNRTNLPDAFSPSRRRGKTDYIPGGNADLVRNWILAIAAEEGPSGTESNDTFIVRNVKHDKEGRCAVIEDTQGRSRLLVGQEGRHGAGGRSQCIKETDQIGIRKSGTSWTVQIPNSRHQGKEGNLSSPATEMHVSVLWNTIKDSSKP